FRPLRPRIVRGALEWRLRQNLKLDEALAAMAHRGADAIGSRVAAADDHHVLALGGDEVAIAMAVQQTLRVRRQEIHREVRAPAHKPAGPEPITATFFPVRAFGGSAVTQPSSQPWSMIAHSMFLIVTGGSLMPSTHEPSHGAGHTRPVNSGKLFVLCSRASA